MGNGVRPTYGDASLTQANMVFPRTNISGVSTQRFTLTTLKSPPAELGLEIITLCGNYKTIGVYT